VPSNAHADCSESDNKVTCEGTDTNGFDAGAADGLNVTVSNDATIDTTDSPGTPALRLNDDNTVSVNSNATIITTDANGIEMGDRNLLSTGPDSTITLTGTASGVAGIRAGDENTAVLDEDGKLVHDGYIVNAGTITIESGLTDSAGIRAGQYNTITNNGTSKSPAVIDVQANDSFGIRVDNGTIVDPADEPNLGNRIDNGQYGEIYVTGDNSVGIQAGDDNGTPEILVDVDGTSEILRAKGQGGISNEGLIQVDGVGAKGIVVGDRNTITNGTTIYGNKPSDTEVIGTIQVNGDGAIGVELGNDNEFVNIGTIDVTGSGIGVFSNSSALGLGNTILNLGTITASSPDGTPIQGGIGSETVDNVGTITGNVDLGAGDDSFVWHTDSVVEGTVSGGLGIDTFVLSGVGEDRFDLGTPLDFEQLEIGRDEDFRWIPIEGGGRFGWSDNLLPTGTWTLTGSGSFSRVAFINGIVALDHTVELTTPGGTTFGVESIFQPQLRSDGTSDVLHVNGDIVVEVPTQPQDGAELRPIFDPSQRFDVATDDPPLTVQVLTASGGGITEFPYFTPPDTPIFTVTPIYTPDELSLEISRNPYASAAQTSNQRAVANYLDRSFASNPSTEFSEAISPIDYLNPRDLRDAYDQLGPELFDAHTSIALSAGYFFSSDLAGRPLACRRQTHETLSNRMTSKRSCGETGWEPWQQVYGQMSQRSGDGIDFDVTGAGATIGVSKRFDEAFTLSLAAGASTNSIDYDLGGNGDVTLAQAGVAGAWEVASMRLESVLSYGYGWHETNRKVTGLSETAKSDHNSHQINALVQASYPLQAGRWQLEPLAGLDYTYLRESTIDESNAGSLDLHVDAHNNSLLAGSMGLRVAASFPRYRFMTIPSLADGIWTPELTVRGRVLIEGDQHDLSAQMQGAPAGVGNINVTAKDSRYLGEFGAGVIFQPRDKVSTFGLSYKGMMGSEGSTQRLMAQFRLPLDQHFLIGSIEPFFTRSYGHYAFLD